MKERGSDETQKGNGCSQPEPHENSLADVKATDFKRILLVAHENAAVMQNELSSF